MSDISTIDRYMISVIKSFRDKTTEDLFNGTNTTEARKIPRAIWDSTFRKLDQLNAAANLVDLKVPPGNKLEALSGSLKEFHSIRC